MKGKKRDRPIKPDPNPFRLIAAICGLFWAGLNLLVLHILYPVRADVGERLSLEGAVQH